MAKAVNTSNSEKLRELAHGAAKGANLLTEGPDKEAAYGAASLIKKIAAKTERKAVSEAYSAVLELRPNATNSELRAARGTRAARRGKDVYLPSWSDSASGLPNALIRSALFSAAQVNRSEGHREALRLEDASVFSFGDISIVYTGYQLSRYDLKVYSACLAYYRDRPLSPCESTHHVPVSYYQFAQRLDVSYSPDVHVAVRESLFRLSKAHIRIRYKPKGGVHIDATVPHLLNVTFGDDYAGSAAGFETKARDLLLIEVPESVAELFGPQAWTAIETKILSYKGLTGWIAAFYSTHNRPKWLPLSTLYSMSGLTSKREDFHRQICAALDKLKDEATPPRSRLIRYYVSKNKANIWVCGADWKAAANLPSENELPPDDGN